MASVRPRIEIAFEYRRQAVSGLIIAVEGVPRRGGRTCWCGASPRVQPNWPENRRGAQWATWTGGAVKVAFQGCFLEFVAHLRRFGQVGQVNNRGLPCRNISQP
jgi:hypothetical protein